MDQVTQQIIQERFAALPKDVQKAISAADLPTRVQNIAEKNGLHIDQSGGLLTEVYIVMLGMEKSDDFSKNVAKNLDISFNMAMAIAGDVNREIFLPIRSVLIDMSNKIDTLEKNVDTSDQPTAPVGDAPATDREQTLHEIENPIPTPARGEIKPQVPEVRPAMDVATTKATDDFIGAKMSAAATTTMPQTVAASPKPNTPQTPPKPAPKAYSADPYREPLN